MNQLILEWVEAGNLITRVITPNDPAHKQTGKILMGRDPAKCDIVFLDKGVSRLHAEIVFDAQKCLFQISNLKPENPIYFNNRAISHQPVTLRQGSRLQLGDIELKVQQVSVQATSPSPAALGTTLSFSQILPLPKRGDQSQSSLLGPGVFTVIWVTLLFSSIGNPGLFNVLLGSYLGTAGFYAIHQLCNKPKPWWILLFPVVTTPVLLLTPVWTLLVIIFRGLLPGDIANASGGVVGLFVAYFFGAGLAEEILKAIPIVALMIWGRMLASPWREQIGVWEPLDGILLGAASGLGFTLLETLGEYVPNIIAETSVQFGADAAELVGIHLLIPRIVGSFFGHMAYSGIFGYYIGLGVLKPKRGWQLVSMGLLLSSVIHALWNTSGTFGALGLPIAGIMAYLMLIGAIRKAKQLSPIQKKPRIA